MIPTAFTRARPPRLQIYLTSLPALGLPLFDLYRASGLPLGRVSMNRGPDAPGEDQPPIALEAFLEGNHRPPLQFRYGLREDREVSRHRPAAPAARPAPPAEHHCRRRRWLSRCGGGP